MSVPSHTDFVLASIDSNPHFPGPPALGPVLRPPVGSKVFLLSSASLLVSARSASQPTSRPAARVRSLFQLSSSLRFCFGVTAVAVTALTAPFAPPSQPDPPVSIVWPTRSTNAITATGESAGRAVQFQCHGVHRLAGWISSTSNTNNKTGQARPGQPVTFSNNKQPPDVRGGRSCGGVKLRAAVSWLAGWLGDDPPVSSCELQSAGWLDSSTFNNTHLPARPGQAKPAQLSSARPASQLPSHFRQPSWFPTLLLLLLLLLAVSSWISWAVCQDFARGGGCSWLAELIRVGGGMQHNQQQRPLYRSLFFLGWGVELPGSSWGELGWTGLGWGELGWTGLGWGELGWTGLGWGELAGR